MFCRGKSGPELGGLPADTISVPADSASEIVKFTISIPRESCTNAKAKYSSSVVPPDPSVPIIHYFCNPSNIDGRVYVCIWLGLGLGFALGFGLGLGFAVICSGHGHLC